MNDNRKFSLETVAEMLVSLRASAYRHLIHEELSYLQGFLTGLMYAEVIDRSEYKLLCALAGNARNYRAAELELDRCQRAAA